MPRNQRVIRAGGLVRSSEGAHEVGRRSHIMAASAVVFILASLAAAVAQPATITVNSLDDPNPGTTLCVLRDAITAANTKAKINGCAAGAGTDIINFSVSAGTIELGSTLPAIVNTLTILGPSAAASAVTISGAGQYRVLLVDPSALLNLSNLTITQGNGGDSDGGGLFNNGGTVAVNNSTFTDNSAASAGAIVNNSGTLTVANSTFSGNDAVGITVCNQICNTAVGNGGAIENSGNLDVSNSTFVNNGSGDGFGGAIASNSGPLTVSNSTFTGNNGGFGGAIFLASGTLAVSNGTFTSNSAVRGGVIYNFEGSVNLNGTILAASSGGNCFGTITDNGYNLSDDASCEFSATGSQNNVPATSSVPGTALNLDPDGLQSNGGPTQTIALEEGSAAIDAIPVAACTYQNVNPCTNPPTISSSGPLVCDQRGEPRPGSGESACAIGAFEPQLLTEFAEFDTGLIVFPKQFAAGGSFTLSADAPAFNPATQAVTMTLASASFGPLVVTIPPGHFTFVKGQYRYSGTLSGVKYGTSISAPVHGVYEFTFAAFGVDVTDISNPVSVMLQIGANIGTDDDVAAAIL
jgi:CSLREA domain-containing protein